MMYTCSTAGDGGHNQLGNGGSCTSHHQATNYGGSFSKEDFGQCWGKGHDMDKWGVGSSSDDDVCGGDDDDGDSYDASDDDGSDLNGDHDGSSDDEDGDDGEDDPRPETDQDDDEKWDYQTRELRMNNTLVSQNKSINTTITGVSNVLLLFMLEKATT